MKYNLTILLILAIYFFGFAQNKSARPTVKDVTFVRNYSNSLFFNVVDRGKYSSFIYGVYGTNFLVDKTVQPSFSYSFQAQERCRELGLVFFQSRLYSQTSKRFLQPDPASQYFSSYCFVGGDPVNYIDFDGNVAKPLFLYHYEKPEDAERLPAVVQGYQAEVDAHYMSFADFINGKPLPAGEWNGNIFIEAHTDNLGRLYSETYTKPELYKTDPGYVTHVVERPGLYGVSVRHKDFARRISKLTKDTGVDLKNIVLGGCESDMAACYLNDQIVLANWENHLPSRFTTYGTLDGIEINYHSGEIDNRVLGGRAGYVPSRRRLQLGFSEPYKYGKRFSFISDGSEYSRIFYRGTSREIPTLRGAELGDVVNARYPQAAPNHFMHLDNDFPAHPPVGAIPY